MYEVVKRTIIQPESELDVFSGGFYFPPPIVEIWEREKGINTEKFTGGKREIGLDESFSFL